MFTPYSRLSSSSVSLRSGSSVLASAARIACSCTSFVSESWRFRRLARSTRNSSTLATTASATTASRSSTRRPNSERGRSVTSRAAGFGGQIGRGGIGNVHVPEAPYRLDVARVRGIGLDQLAQARYLHVDRPVEHFVIAAAREHHELLARERLPRML